jgi:hypothetical protein
VARSIKEDLRSWRVRHVARSLARFMSPPIEPSRVSSNVPESMGDVAADEAMRTSALSPAEERFERLRRRTGMVLAPLATR